MNAADFVEARCQDERRLVTESPRKPTPLRNPTIAEGAAYWAPVRQIDPKMDRLLKSYEATVRLYRTTQKSSTQLGASSYKTGFADAALAALENLATIWSDHPDYSILE